ncbi:DUF177 domain-containing protein [[Phormidium] sp. ETS-05]|uniref:YceD family protein n=1 Tax=[Phormidium] sp. ETS-05 TaxID=222819 RepID=UPI0018EF1ADF|nr:YceD family protein [[Phormidium] sp. ETS-05]
METIYIPQLAKAPEKTEKIELQEFLPDLETLMPVRGWLMVKHQGNYLEVSAKAEAIVTLTCNRCLQQYNHRLKLKTTELIWLDESAGISDIKEWETTVEELVETLPPDGYFDPGVWLYEQFCLAIPPRQLCAEDCPGIQVEPASTTATVLTDRRWASLADLKNQLPN